ncbi:sigma-70 family RNA polymerase sigma factor [Actinacidiphila acidipaludis]|uniref:Sigma-70 family RNA polymerase sigma factor n=1 Tax=Actinacidiphila acidipaludis TaxID=2873382 RepID=A0ABS7Q5I9_9ACTN|nr:sigma-70 family RNA polymerase sigma factor [Streptomyces acidipaludis]MBY8878426.1 sigma-70 family RNA polymerase sigma factor [Streptomyces acidipaludis]
MRAGDRVGPDPAVVAAARSGDQQALDALVAECLPLVYNIVGRALDGHDDVDDVVQETLLRVVRGLGELRDPTAFRSWLVAIAVRQVRDREQARKAAWHQQTALDAAELIADPASDFAALTIIGLGLTDQRREIAEATRWLDGDDRTLLALWWLEETGDIGRSELAGALGLTRQHAAVRVQRMKEQLDISRTVVRALGTLGSADACAGLRELTAGWDGVPSPLWRKRFARHVRGCGLCGPRSAALLPMDRLLSGLPLLPVPLPLAAHLLPGTAHLAASPVSAAQAPGPHQPAPQPHSGDPAPGAAHSAAGHPQPPTQAVAPHAAQRTAPRPRPPRRSGAHGGGRGGLRARLWHTPFGAPATAVAAVAAVTAAALLAVHLASGSSAPAADAAPRHTVAAPATPAPPPATPTASPTTSSPRTTASRRPTPKATTRRPAVPAAPPAPPAATPRKGVGVWSFDGVNTALARSGAGWYYTWSTTHAGISGPGFVPMVWGAGSADAASLARARQAGPYLLGFNEPDMAGQSNMTVDQALALWPSLMSTGRVLGSPAVAYGADTPGGWLDRFMSGAAAKGYRVDFIALHWYGGDFTTPDAVAQLQRYLEAVHNRYHKPVWLTEFALIDFSHGTRFPTDAQQAAFVTAATAMLDGLPWLQRYAWFGLPAKDGGPSSGLFHGGAVPTAAGTAFEKAR